MKRAFLYGMGWTSISLFVTMAELIPRNYDNYFTFDVAAAAILMTFIFFLIASHFPHNHSWRHATGGWLLGYGFGIVAWVVVLFSLNYIDTRSLVYTTFGLSLF